MQKQEQAYWQLGWPSGSPVSRTQHLANDTDHACRDLLRLYRERKVSGYFEPLRPRTQDERWRRLEGMMFQLVDFQLTGKVPEFWTNGEGMPPRPHKQYEEVRADQQRELEQVQERASREGNAEGMPCMTMSSRMV